MVSMKEIKVFYSWQKDLPNNTNRSLIERAIESAAKSIRLDNSIQIEPVVDRDTKGIPGSPDIAAEILKKIEQSHIFVCDVSIISKCKRPTPNPNVLVELGYAMKVLGSARIIMILNSAFGEPELLPFDLRKNKVVTYKMSRFTRNRTAVRKALGTWLVGELKEIIDDLTFSTIRKRTWPENGIALAKEGDKALEIGDFDTVNDVFLMLLSLSTSTVHESHLRRQTPIPDATPFPLAMKLLRSVISTDFRQFLHMVRSARKVSLIGDRPFLSLAEYETIPDKSIGVVTGVLSACCIYQPATRNYSAEHIIVQELCNILSSLAFIFIARGLSFPEPISQLWITLDGERTTSDGQPKEYIPIIQTVNRVAFLPQPLFDFAIANLKYNQNIRPDLMEIDAGNGYEMEAVGILIKSWAALPNYAFIQRFQVKNEAIMNECKKLMIKNNEIGQQAVTKISELLISERNILLNQGRK